MPGMSCKQCWYTEVFLSVRDEDVHSEILRDLEASVLLFINISLRIMVSIEDQILLTNFFQVTKCFPQDIMHVLFEGILKKERQLFIKYC